MWIAPAAFEVPSGHMVDPVTSRFWVSWQDGVEPVRHLARPSLPFGKAASAGSSFVAKWGAPRRPSGRGGKRPRRELGAGRASLAVRWAVEVDDERALPDHGEDDLLRLIERVDVTVNQPGRDMEESAFLDLRALPAAGAELEAGASSDDMPQDITVTVVMPARNRASLGTDTNERRAAGLESNLAHDARCRGGGAQAIRRNRGDSFGCGHRSG